MATTKWFWVATNKTGIQQHKGNAIEINTLILIFKKYVKNLKNVKNRKKMHSGW